MKNQSLKTALTFWQEIVFSVSIGLLLIEITKWVMISQTMDVWDILPVCFLLPLFICLIGQFFWKNETLSLTLSILLGISSVIVIFMALYGLRNSLSYRTESFVMLVIGLVCVIASITMSRKYNSNKFKHQYRYFSKTNIK